VPLSDKPIVLLIDADPRELERGESYLRSELDDSFRVEPVGSLEIAESLVRQWHHENERVVLVIVHAAGDPLRGFLGSVREMLPDTRIVGYCRAEETDDAEEQNDFFFCTLRDPWLAPDETVAPILKELLFRRREERQRTVDQVEVIGYTWAPRSHQIRDQLARNRVRYHWIDPEAGSGQRISEASGAFEPDDLPLIVFPDGSRLANPDDDEIAEKLGFQTEAGRELYDLIIVGGGPAGLAAAVYGASEGLRVVVIEQVAPGGQAGCSALIENYLGFPEGISGADLAARAVDQAVKFGAEIVVPRHATRLIDHHSYKIVDLGDDGEVVGYSVLIATGVEYRRLSCPGAEKLSGAGIYYGATTAEAARYRGEEVCLLGGGNSAGQAAMLLARYARRVLLITAEETLSETMSQYLIERIEATGNIDIRTSSTVVDTRGVEKLESVVVENETTGAREEIATRGLFIWIGASPHTDWVAGTLERDDDGFILTGRDIRSREPFDALGRWPYALETSVPGVFVAGDVRHDSVKRIGSAVGEGSMAIQFVHRYLREA
jgi:thioredoxin reductase (NADPH)